MAWLPLREAAEALNTTTNALDKRGRRGAHPRRMDSLRGAYVYEVDDALAELAGLRDYPDVPAGAPGAYDEARDIYLLNNPAKPHLRPRIVPGWVVRQAIGMHTAEAEAIADALGSLMLEPPPKSPTIRVKGAEQDFEVVCTPTDLHFGKRGDGLELNGEHYDRATCRLRLLRSADCVAEMVLRYGQPLRWLVGVGSDWFHVDTDAATTTKGTPQDTDGSQAVIWREGVQLACDYVERLRQFAPVHLVLMAGNHDRTSSHALMSVLQYTYEHAEDVTFSADLSARQYVMAGRTLLGFTHGDDGAITDLPSLMAREARELWGAAEHAAWFTGHKHHAVHREMHGVDVYTMPSLSGPDRWHHRKGFVGSQKRLAAYIVDHGRGVVGQLMGGE